MRPGLLRESEADESNHAHVSLRTYVVMPEDLGKKVGMHVIRGQKVCRWYDGTSGMKKAYDAGMLDRIWIDNYCLNGGKNCIRKNRFDMEGYVSPDYVLPDGTVDEKLKRWITGS